MKIKSFLSIAVILFSLNLVAAQTIPSLSQNEATPQTLNKISEDLTLLNKSLLIFNQRLNEFLENTNKYKGIQLSEKQQKLLFGYEILNQTEQLAATLRKSLIETSEREATVRRRIGQIQFDLRRENIERSVQFQGTTKVEEAREARRRTLENERNTLQNLLFEIETSKSQVSENLKQTEIFAESFRKSLFAQIRTAMEEF